MSAMRRLAVGTYSALLLGALVSLLPFGDAHADPGRRSSTVPVVVGSPGDHWADALGYTYIGRDTKDGRYGYKVSFRAADGCEMTIFWPRETIDFRGDAPGYRLHKVRVPTGWFWYPSRLTAKSLPRVHEWVLYIEAYYARQADGAIAAAQGFALVAGMGTLAPAPRVPLAAPRAASVPARAIRAPAAARTVLAPTSARAANTVADLTAAAARARAAVGPGRGAVHGTRAHTAFRAEVEALGRSNLSTEVSYLNGRVVPHGTKGSVRLDVVEGPLSAPTAVYDLKTGSATLRTTRINQIRGHLPGGGNIPIVEIR